MLAETANDAPLPEASELSASLEVLVSPDESSDEDDPPPPPLPPPPQEITRRLIINTIRKKRFFFSQTIVQIFRPKSPLVICPCLKMRKLFLKTSEIECENRVLDLKRTAFCF